jgi:hypothetical protein
MEKTMNNMTQAALAVLVLGVCSTGVYAEDEAARGSSGGGYNWGNCTTLGCEKDIPIKLEIPKKCEISGGAAITLSKDGGAKTSSYTVRSNTHYTLNIQTANTGTSPLTYVKHEDDGSVRVSTTIGTTKSGGGTIPWGNSNHNGLADDVYTVSVNNSAVSAFQRAGTYTDTYRIKVFY